MEWKSTLGGKSDFDHVATCPDEALRSTMNEMFCSMGPYGLSQKACVPGDHSHRGFGALKKAPYLAFLIRCPRGHNRNGVGSGPEHAGLIFMMSWLSTMQKTVQF